jgi:hypothetical protein
MANAISANTEINVIINNKHTFTIINNPENGLKWRIKSDMNKEDYIQGLYALIEAAHNISIGKIEMDTKRVLENKKPLARG